MYYLDIILIINGAMDIFLLVFTAHLLQKKIHVLNVSIAAAIGELPIFLMIFGFTTLEFFSRIFVPVAMLTIGLKIKKAKELIRGVIYFNLLAAASGGVYYLLAGWLNMHTAESDLFTLSDIWLLLLISFLLVGGYKFWEKSQKRNLLLSDILYNVEIHFDTSNSLKIKALLDTGNELRDPLTGSPVLLLEEQAVFKELPAIIQQFLKSPWKEYDNPWVLIWNNEEYALQKMVFISAKGIGGKTWLPGIRVSKIEFQKDNKKWEQAATIAFVPQVLSKENEFQALLHPEHIQKFLKEEEIAS